MINRQWMRIVWVWLAIVFKLEAGMAPKPPADLTGLQTYVKRMGMSLTPYLILVSTDQQTLTVYQNKKVLLQYVISTSRYGLGQVIHSFKTPVGLHRIVEKIGHGVPLHGIFKNRQYLNMVWEPVPKAYHSKDYISTRIIRLEGLEAGVNQGFDHHGRLVDTMARVVYIHGTTREWELGRPATKGCVHMSAEDITDLFDMVPVGTLVAIL